MIETNKTLVQFQLCTEKTKLGTPAAGTIVFIQDTNELYLDGVYYGLSVDAAKELSNATQDIGRLRDYTDSLSKLNLQLTTYVANLRDFADGGTNSKEGPVLTTHDSGVLKGKDNVKAAIDALAAAVNTLNAKVWTAVNKPADAAGKFAISVRQGTDGSITVDYEYVKSTDVKRTTEHQTSIAGATVEDALETLKGKAAAAQSKADANETAIGVIKGTGEGSISKAVSDAKSELIGTGEGVWAEG